MKIPTKKLVICALFLVLGIVFPTIFHMAGLGSAFLPMHIPVFICAFLCGPMLGAVVAVCTVFLSSMLTGMPMLFPVGVAMMIELAVYAIAAGALGSGKTNSIPRLYGALIVAVVLGRIANGLANVVLLGTTGASYSAAAFVSGTLITTIPGTILIFVFVPGLTKLISKLVKLHE